MLHLICICRFSCFRPEYLALSISYSWLCWEIFISTITDLYFLWDYTSHTLHSCSDLFKGGGCGYRCGVWLFCTDHWAATRVVTYIPFWSGLVLNQMSKHVCCKTEVVSLVSAEFISWVFSLQVRKKRICIEQFSANPYEKSYVKEVKIYFGMY